MLEVVALRRAALQPASFSLAAGECLAVRGPSGAGKSLLLRAIADLDPNEGQVSLDGQARDSMTAPQWRRLVGYLPAEPGWWADSIGEHFSNWTTVSPMLDALGLPAAACAWPVSRASTGERLRLALVRALSVGPRVLLLDEPTAALDAVSVAAVEALIAAKVVQGMAVLWVTHDTAQAKRVASRCLVVEAGQLRQEGPEWTAISL
ncbi:MAG TPA: ABC transporter ATP-binding protein [Patescibacteria group bacterium]|nr:ABC transporter ATP-binding protein [Patescibacteria group bacterium]